MATESVKTWHDGVGRVFFQLLILVLLVFGISYYNNNYLNKKSEDKNVVKKTSQSDLHDPMVKSFNFFA